VFSMSVFQAAHTAAAQAGVAQGGGFSMIIMLVVMFAIIYLLMIRPQQKQQKRHREFLSKLQKSDEVMTQSGLIGRIYAVEETVVTLEIADKVRVKVLKHAISSPKPGSDSEASQEDGKK